MQRHLLSGWVIVIISLQVFSVSHFCSAGWDASNFGLGQADTICSQEVLDHIQNIVQDMATPSWFTKLPRNFGNASVGTIKAMNGIL